MRRAYLISKKNTAGSCLFVRWSKLAKGRIRPTVSYVENPVLSFTHSRRTCRNSTLIFIDVSEPALRPFVVRVVPCHVKSKPEDLPTNKRGSS